MTARHNNQAALAAAKRALLGSGGREAHRPIQRFAESASQFVRSHPVACLAGAAAVGAVIVSQSWARRLLVGTARKAAGIAVMKALATDLHRR